MRKRATRAEVSDRAILENPYRMVETDLGDPDDHAVSLGVVDRGLMPDSTVAAAHPGAGALSGRFGARSTQGEISFRNSP